MTHRYGVVVFSKCGCFSQQGRTGVELSCPNPMGYTGFACADTDGGMIVPNFSKRTWPGTDALWYYITAGDEVFRVGSLVYLPT